MMPNSEIENQADEALKAVKDLLELRKKLTDKDKVLIEYMDGVNLQSPEISANIGDSSDKNDPLDAAEEELVIEFLGPLMEGMAQLEGQPEGYADDLISNLKINGRSFLSAIYQRFVNFDEYYDKIYKDGKVHDIVIRSDELAKSALDKTILAINNSRNQASDLSYTLKFFQEAARSLKSIHGTLERIYKYEHEKNRVKGAIKFNSSTLTHSENHPQLK